jgi:membrane-associated protease RseP (regulator of RpoE activity)
VEQVIQGSPAERAGLRPGDTLVAVDGRPIPAGRLEEMAGRLRPGDPVRLRVLRGGQEREITAVADRRPVRPPIPARASAGDPTRGAAPIVRVENGTLVARNVDSAPGVHGYWLESDGRTVFRSLGAWSTDGVDAQVQQLLACAESTRWAPAAAAAAAAVRVDLREVQIRADSLRMLMARRVLEHERDLAELSRRIQVREAPAAPAGPAEPREPREPREVHVVAPGGSYVLRMDDHVTAGLRGVAGAELASVEPELAAYFSNVSDGLLVLRISAGTPAARAGLMPGDVIIRGDGRPLTSVHELRALLATGDREPVELRIVRKGRTRTINLPR